jgi:RNA polymerase sigma-70 factor (ECF subfamily)
MSGETFMGLLAPNLRPLRRLLEGRIKIPGQADDVLQEAVLHAFARRHQLRLRSKFKSWLWTIVLNEMRMFFRVERPAISLDELPGIDPSDRAPSPLARFERLERLERLYAGLSKLSERDRTVIRLRDLDGLSIAETADVLAISKAAAKSTHFRARKRLAYALQGVSRAVVVEGCRASDRSGKHSVRKPTPATISINRGH